MCRLNLDEFDLGIDFLFKYTGKAQSHICRIFQKAEPYSLSCLQLSSVTVPFSLPQLSVLVIACTFAKQHCVSVSQYNNVFNVRSSTRLRSGHSKHKEIFQSLGRKKSTAEVKICPVCLCYCKLHWVYLKNIQTY